MKALLVCKFSDKDYICAGVATVAKKNIGKIRISQIDGYGEKRFFGKTYCIPVDNDYVADVIANKDLPALEKTGTEYKIARNPVHFWIFDWEAYKKAKENQHD